jgi:zinc D-Ala-D-Ala carboxypeptidase|tara:strand:+ start:129 stop:602 length:474 start_codon:yes stop_codon:yes gene_type:complete
MVRLSTNFSLQEFTKSQTATRQGLDNTPNDEHLASATALFENVVQKVRDNFGVTVINSGYRGPALNTAVGGSSNSQHCKGEAVDIECPGIANETVAQWIADNLEFDQLILEFAEKGIPDAGWVHVSYVGEGNRKQILTALRDPATRKTVYLAGLGHV